MRTINCQNLLSNFMKEIKTDRLLDRIVGGIDKNTVLKRRQQLSNDKLMNDIVEVNSSRVQMLGRDVNWRHDTNALRIEIRDFRAEKCRGLSIDRFVPRRLATIKGCENIDTDVRVNSEQVLQHDNIGRNFGTNFRHGGELNDTPATSQHVLERTENEGDLVCRR